MIRKNTKTTIVIGVAIVLLGAFANGFLAKFKTPPVRKTADQIKGLPVSVVEVAAKDFNLAVTGYGTIKPRVTINLASELSGNIVFRHPMLEAGNTIASGEVLIGIDPEPYRLKLERARSQKDQAISQLKAIDQEIDGQQKTLKVSESLLEIQEKELKRFQSLAKADAVSRSQLEKAMSAFQTASAAKIRDNNNLIQAKARKETLLSTLEQAETSLREAQLNFDKTTIKAPFNAKIDERMAETGEYVSPGKALLRLHDPSTYEVGIPLGVHDILWLTGQYKAAKSNSDMNFANALIGASARIELKNPGSSPGQCDWHGKVDRMSAQADIRSRTFTVYVSIDTNAQENRDFTFPLSGGLFVQVELSGSNTNGLFQVPRDLISKNNTVNVYEEGKLAIRNVDIARVDRGTAYILGELKPGDLLVTTHVPEVIPGMALSIASGPVGIAEKAN